MEKNEASQKLLQIFLSKLLGCDSDNLEKTYRYVCDETAIAIY